MKRFQTLIAISLCLLAAGCAHTKSTRSDFLTLIQRPGVPLSPRIEPMPNTNGLAQFRFSFATEAGQRVPGVLMKAPNSVGRRPVVIALHGTGGSKANMLSMCRKLATNGFVAVAIDGRYHGDRINAGRGTTNYQEAIVRTWRGGREHPFYYDTVWDVRRLVDYLQTRPDVDAKRVGLIGISKGGIETYLAAAVDKRFAVVVPCIGVQSFNWALQNEQWQSRIKTVQNAFDTAASEAGVTNVTSTFVQEFYDRVVPGIYDEFDGPAMLPLIAPRPLLIINSDSDPNTPLPGVQEAAAAAEEVYEEAGAADRLVLLIQKNTAHQVKPESEQAAMAWFVKWLKP